MFQEGGIMSRKKEVCRTGGEVKLLGKGAAPQCSLKSGEAWQPLAEQYQQLSYWREEIKQEARLTVTQPSGQAVFPSHQVAEWV